MIAEKLGEYSMPRKRCSDVIWNCWVVSVLSTLWRGRIVQVYEDRPEDSAEHLAAVVRS